MGKRARYDLVVLAGGASRRMGTDKVLLPVGERSMLSRVLAAGAGARRRVVVGPPRALPSAAEVVWTRESPPGGGPLAGLAAGVSALSPPFAEVVVVLAADMPLLDADVVSALVAAVDEAAVLVDAEGRPQPLAAAYRRDALDAALARIGDPAGRPARLLLAELRHALVDAPDAALDADTPADLARIRRRFD